MHLLFKNHFRNAVLALIIANIIWGAAPPIFKWALQDIGPFTLAFLRFFLASIIFLPFAYKSLFVHQKDYGKLILVGFLGVTINIIFFFMGLEFAPSINASVIGSAGPIFLILASIFILKEKPKRRVVMGSLIGLAGVILIMIKPLFSEEPNLNLLGNFFFFLAMLGGLGHTIFGRELLRKYSAAGVTFWSFFIGALTFFPLFVNENVNNGFLNNLTFPAVTGVVFGVTLCSALAYFLFFWALKYMPAAETGVFVYLDPIITVLVALPLLGEVPDTFYYIGSLFVFFGIYIAEGRIHYHPFHLLKKK
jgi:drug/metabolite transporter (DMT)-like permease